MKNEVFKSTQEALHTFVTGLKAIAEKLGETDFEDYLKDNVLPVLLKKDTVCGDSIWNKMEVVKAVQIDSILEERSLIFKAGLHLMNEDAICWLYNHIYRINEVIKLCESTVPKDEEWHVQSLRKDAEELQSWINSDVFERIQNYTYEIKKLRGVES